jgi:cysteine-rich repeat protein
MRVAAWGWVIACVAVMGACVESSTVTCGQLTCPPSFTCNPAQLCVSQDALTACAGKLDGDACTADRASGQCSGGTCIAIVCGNGRVDPGEICDDGNLDYGDNCNPTCQSELFCGNGYIDPGELCDCGDGMPGHQNATCDAANSNDATATCRPDCTPHSCGDGVVENSEQCEPGVLGTSTCATLGFYQGQLACNNVCQFDVAGCQLFCGDGVPNGPEACDGAPPVGEGCVDYGFDAGPLGCSSSLCRPDFAACRNIGWVPFGGDNRAFYSVWGLSPSDVWGGTSNGGLLHWDGSQWKSSALSGVTYSVTGLWGTASNDVYAMTDDQVFHYNGSAWSLATNLPFAAAAISGSGPDRVIVVGLDGGIYTWDGTAWGPMTSGTSYALNAVQVLSPTLAYAVGGDDADGVMLKWNGSIWSQVAIPSTTGITAVWGRSATDLYIGDYYALLHWDGAAWSTISLGFGNGPTAISGTATDVFVAFDTVDDVIAQFDGSAWTLHDTDLTSSVSDLWAAPDGTAFAASFRMARYSGSAWTKPRPAVGVQINAAGGTPSGAVIVVGNAGFALQRAAGYWRRLPGDIARNMYGVSSNVIVGERGTIGTFDGTRINARVSNTNEDLFGVWAASTTDAWAVGTNGAVVHFDGTSGTVGTSGTAVELHGVWGAASNDVYAVGDGGVIIHWNGTAWSSFASGTGADLRGISGTAANNFFVVGGGGTARRWNGTAWIDLAPPTANDLRSVWAPPFLSEIYVVQSTGTMLQWTNPSGWTSISNVSDVQAVGGRGAESLAFGLDMTLRRREAVTGSTQWVTQLATNSEPNDVFASMYAVSPTDVYATSQKHLLHFDGYMWSHVTHAPLQTMGAVTGTGANDIWVLTGSFEYSRWNGTTWTYGTTGPGVVSGMNNPVDISAGAPNRPFAVNAAGDGREFDGASTWVDIDPDATATLTGVWAANASTVFAVGYGGAALQWNGTAWSTIPAASTNLGTTALEAVWGTSASNVFVGGDKLIARWQGGTAWTTYPVIGHVLDLFGHSATDVFGVGVAGLIEHFDGTQWAPLNTNTFSQFSSVTGAGKMTWFGEHTIRGLRRSIAW